MNALKLARVEQAITVENIDTPNISRRALKLSEDKKDRLQHRRKREKA